MQPLAKLCTPHQSVFDSQRRDTVLDISDLINDKIKPDEFFEENYITEGMESCACCWARMPPPRVLICSAWLR